MPQSPLDDPNLAAVEVRLNAGDLEGAQRALADIDDPDSPGARYLAVRLLFARGRLGPEDVVQRLRDLLTGSGPFAEAETLLAMVERTNPARRPVGFRRIADDLADFDSRPDLDPPTPRQLESLPVAAPSHASEPGMPALVVPALDAPVLEISDFVPPELAPALVGTRPPENRNTARSPSSMRARVPSSTPPVAKPRPSAPVAPTRQSSSPPAASKTRSSSPPALLEPHALLDAGEYEQALELLEREEHQGNAELALTHARALVGVERRDDARRVLDKLAQAPLLDPEVRAGCARLLIELGAENAALTQAEIAYEADPSAAGPRVTLAWACIRVGRRGAPPEVVERAGRLLNGLRARDTEWPALVYALRACVQAALGEAERVIPVAQRALAVDPGSVDALAAIAVASARLGRSHEALQTWLRLLDLDQREADAVSVELQWYGVRVADVDLGSSDDIVEGIWDDAEIRLVQGQYVEAMMRFELGCTERLRVEPDQQRPNARELATQAADWLTTAPVFRHFAPFDLSLWSLPRVEAALQLIYGMQPRPWLSIDDGPTRVLLAAYIAETLTQAYRASFSGVPEDPTTWTVQGSFGQAWPYEMVSQRLDQGSALLYDLPPEFLPDEPAADAWLRHLPRSAEPPAPWDPVPWPEPEQMERLGVAMRASVVARHCQHVHGPLDGSMTSLGALDAYLALVAPLRAPQHENAGYRRRLSVLLGAYVGEVLRNTFGGMWLPREDDVLDEHSYRLELSPKLEVEPVVQLLSRVSLRSALPLFEYAEKIARKV